MLTSLLANPTIALATALDYEAREDAYAIVPLEWWAQRTAGLAGNESPPRPLSKDPSTWANGSAAAERPTGRAPFGRAICSAGRGYAEVVLLTPCPARCGPARSASGW
jgi:hypothetical protein